MAIKNIVFDMGNVLLYWKPILTCRRHCGNQELAEKMCEAIFRHPDWCNKVDLGVLTEKEYLKEVESRLDSPAEKALAAEILNDYALDATFPIPESEQLVSELIDRGFRLFLLSNASAGLRKYFYKIPNVERFDGVVISAEEKIMKPDPRFYDLVIQRFGLLPEETLFVDDLPMNIEGAIQAGWHGYLFDTRDVNGLRKLLML